MANPFGPRESARGFRYARDGRVVLTLDAGGSKLAFGAFQGAREVIEPVVRSWTPDRLEPSLQALVDGFSAARSRLGRAPAALSFSFPGPSFYRDGVIGDLPNLPAFRGGVALGPYLEERFGLPVFINNDGNLFALGEAVAGLLPEVNERLEATGSPKRFANLLGLTIGTGFGAGAVVGGRLITGDNDSAAEIWPLRNKLLPDYCVEAYVGRRYVSRLFAELAGLPLEAAPEPKELFDIAEDPAHPQRDSAVRAFALMGEAAGAATASSIALLDGLVVIGGGLAGAARYFLPALISEMNSRLHHYNGSDVGQLCMQTFNLEEPESMARFLRGDPKEVSVPGSARTVRYDALPRTGVGLSRLGTSRAVSLGAYAFALDALDRGRAG